MKKIEEAIEYFEDAIRESDEIIEDCTPDLQADLTEQKGHFEVALSAMQKSSWIPVKERLPENGQEVLIYYFDEGYGIHQICILDYFYEGTIMDSVVDYSEESPEKRLLNTLFNPNNQIKAPEDGFYIYEDEREIHWRKHADVITHWMPLPEPPSKAKEGSRMKCLFCEDTYTAQDITELREIGESYHLEEKQFVCPDCYDNLRRLPLEEHLKALLQGRDYEWEVEK